MTESLATDLQHTRSFQGEGQDASLRAPGELAPQALGSQIFPEKLFMDPGSGLLPQLGKH